MCLSLPHRLYALHVGFLGMTETGMERRAMRRLAFGE